jgi:hypothetical protein
MEVKQNLIDTLFEKQDDKFSNLSVAEPMIKAGQAAAKNDGVHRIEFIMNLIFNPTLNT